MSTHPDGDPLPEHVGPFRVIGLVGGGGMGVVYRAVGADGRPIAVKVVRATLASRDAQLRFSREARVRIDHPNVVRVLDAGAEPGGVPWIAFELLDGETLEDRIARGPLDPDELTGIVAQAGAGLSAAHALGVVHRDLKPANLFLCRDGTVKVLDFGIALGDADATRFTVAGAILGTPSYLAPEQARGELELDARVDVWALGVVLWESLVGRSPFERATALATVLAVIVDEPRAPSAERPGLPATLDAIVARCLRKDRDARFASVAELTAALRERQAASGGAAQVVPGPPSIAPGEQRLVALLVATGVSNLSAISDAVQRRGGIVVPLFGQLAAGVFGGHASEGDELARALDAALEARWAAASMGVSSGRATSSSGGGIAGDVVEGAERACAAGLDGVGISSRFERLVGTRFRHRGAEGGLLEVLDSSAGSVAPPAANARVPFVGRELERAQILDAIAIARAESRAVAMLVVAPPGGGKSRLVESAADSLATLDEPVEVLRGRGEPLHRHAELSLLRSLLARRIRGLEETLGNSDDAIRALAATAIAQQDEAKDCAGFLGELLGVGLGDSDVLRAAQSDPQLMRDRLRLALLDWLAGVASQRPTVLLIEDVQWADDASLDLLEELAERVRALPVAMVLTTRPELLERRPSLLAAIDARRVDLRGLGLAAIAALGRAVAGTQISEELVRWLHERTGGNPLFVEHIVLELREHGALDAELAELPVPVSVEAAVQSRLDHLPAPEKEACKRASVLGRPFPVDEIEALGIPNAPDVVAALVRREVLSPRTRAGARAKDREHWFRSAIVAEVAYRMLAGEVGRELHARAAQWLAAREGVDPVEVARHFDLGGRGSEAAAFYVQAVLAAARHGDGATVLRCADRAFELGPPPPTRFALHFARAEALLFLGRGDEELAALDAALGCDPTERERARVLVHRGSWLRRAGRLDEALDAARAAVSSAHASGEPEIVAVALGWYGIVLVQLGRAEEAHDAIFEAASLGQHGSPLTRIYAASWRASLAGATGDLGARCDASRAAVLLATEAGDVRRASAHEINLADAFNRFGAHAEAEASLRAALDRCRRVGNRLNESYAHANLGYALAAMGREQEALESLDEAIRLAGVTGQVRLALAARIYRARAQVSSKSPDALLAEADALGGEALSLGARDLAVGAFALAARCALRARDTAHALLLSERALTLRDTMGGTEEDEAEVFLVRVAALTAAGQDAEASEVATRGRSRLLYVARRIADAEWRRRYLQDVAAHRELLASRA